MQCVWWKTIISFQLCSSGTIKQGFMSNIFERFGGNLLFDATKNFLEVGYDNQKRDELYSKLLSIFVVDVALFHREVIRYKRD